MRVLLRLFFGGGVVPNNLVQTNRRHCLTHHRKPEPQRGGAVADIFLSSFRRRQSLTMLRAWRLLELDQIHQDCGLGACLCHRRQTLLLVVPDNQCRLLHSLKVVGLDLRRDSQVTVVPQRLP